MTLEKRSGNTDRKHSDGGDGEGGGEKAVGRSITVRRRKKKYIISLFQFMACFSSHGLQPIVSYLDTSSMRNIHEIFLKLSQTMFFLDSVLESVTSFAKMKKAKNEKGGEKKEKKRKRENSQADTSGQEQHKRRWMVERKVHW